MFHVVLVLPILIVMLIFAAIVFTAIVAIAASLVGGISVAALVKNKVVKKFIIMGFCIIFLTGITVILPFLVNYKVISGTVGFVAACITSLIVLGISIAGMILSVRLSNKIAKVAVPVVFSFVIVGALVLLLCLIAGGYFVSYIN